MEYVSGYETIINLFNHAYLIINKQLIFVFVALEGNGGELVMDINDGAGLPSYMD